MSGATNAAMTRRCPDCVDNDTIDVAAVLHDVARRIKDEERDHAAANDRVREAADVLAGALGAQPVRQQQRAPRDEQQQLGKRCVERSGPADPQS